MAVGARKRGASEEEFQEKKKKLATIGNKSCISVVAFRRIPLQCTSKLRVAAHAPHLKNTTDPTPSRCASCTARFAAEFIAHATTTFSSTGNFLWSGWVKERSSPPLALPAASSSPPKRLKPQEKKNKATLQNDVILDWRARNHSIPPFPRRSTHPHINLTPINEHFTREIHAYLLHCENVGIDSPLARTYALMHTHTHMHT